MSLELLNLLNYVGIAAGVVAMIAVLEVLMRTVFTRCGTPASNDRPHRIGVEQPRVLHHS